MDWQRDEGLDAWIADANQRRQYQTTALRAPAAGAVTATNWQPVR